jgi:hypothetical protein
MPSSPSGRRSSVGAEVGEGAPEALAGLPLGAAALARAYGAVIEARVRGDADGLAAAAPAHLLRPLLLASADGVEPAPRAAPYRLVGGALSADVGAPGDAEILVGLLELCAAEGVGDAEGIAARAQSWRLPVLPFRRRGERQIGEPPRILVPRREAPAAVPRERLAALRVLDLSTLWAGPLATHLLAGLGASVTRVTFPGRAIREGGPAEALFSALAAGKEEVALDLREPADRARFERLVAESDVLVESFSRRVMPNLGYDEAALRALNSGLVVAAVRAFPGWRPERDWLGYGSGVHAALGLGELPDGRFSGAVVSYPDPLAGLDLCGRVLAALGARGGAGRSLETSLYGAAEPLLAFGPNPRLADRPDAEELRALAAPTAAAVGA